MKADGLSNLVQSLGQFMETVQTHRDNWPRHVHKELWFRGESRSYVKYGTFLHPVLYRPKTEPISKILAKERELYQDFMRCAVQLADGKADSEDWDWDAYFLMRHHSAPTQLLDWSDGALIALHFAIQCRDKDDETDAVVYVLEPDLLKIRLTRLPETTANKSAWKQYFKTHKTEGVDGDDYAQSYLPAEKPVRARLPLPRPPMVLDFPHITRRVAAQRSRFVVFGSAPNWLASRFGKDDDFPIKAIVIDGKCKQKIRDQLRDSGITELVIFPDLDGLGREMNQIFWDWR